MTPYFDLKDEPGKQRWAMDHYLDHWEIAKTLISNGKSPVLLPIQSILDFKSWLDAHNKVSQSQWTLSGGGSQPIDLGNVNFTSNEEMGNWFNNHSSWHKQVRASLGI